MGTEIGGGTKEDKFSGGIDEEDDELLTAEVRNGKHVSRNWTWREVKRRPDVGSKHKYALCVKE